MQGISRKTILGVALLAVLLAAPSADAATEIGDDFPTGFDSTCATSGTSNTWLQSGSPGDQYAAPSAGVITRWSFDATPIADVPTGLKLKVGRPAGGNDFAILGESGLHAPAGGVVNTYNDARITVAAGDVIGLYVEGPDADCGDVASASYLYHGETGDLPPSPTPVTLDDIVGSTFKFNVSAILEPDADSDGFGDETQDQCVGQAGPDACQATVSQDTNPPETTITDGPAKRSGAKAASFSFTSSEQGSTFECRKFRKDKPKTGSHGFKPCSSPKDYRVKWHGKRVFEVRATDAAGNADPTPASHTWATEK